MSIIRKWNAPVVGYSRKTVGCVPFNARNACRMISSLLFTKIKSN